MTQPDMTRITQAIEEYEKLREQLEAMKEEQKALQKLVDLAEADIITVFMDWEEATGVDLRLTYHDRNYSVGVKSYYGIPKANKDAAYEQIRSLGMADLIQERVDERTLTKELEGIKEEAGGMMPDEYGDLMELLTTYDKSTLRRVKA